MNERKHGDQSLASLYQDIAVEKTTAELDEKVLKKAGLPRKRRTLDLLPFKPWAWAATIGLSIAIVIELQQSTPDAILPEGVSNAPTAESAVPVVTSARRDVAALEAESDFAQDSGLRQDFGLVEEAEIADLPASSNMPAQLQELEELVREEQRNSGESAVRNRAQSVRLSPSMGFAPRAAKTAERYCNEPAVLTAKTWFECILELEEAGRQEDADFERSLLMTEHPEFQTR